MKRFEELYFKANDLRKEILSELIKQLEKMGHPVGMTPEDQDGLPVTWVNRNGDWHTTMLSNVKVIDGKLVLEVNNPWERGTIDITEDNTVCKYFDSLFLTDILEIVENELDSEDAHTELKDDITALYNDYVDHNKKEPRFATVSIKYPQEAQFDVVFKMSSDMVEEEDEQIFYYCDSLNDLLGCSSSLCGDEFIVVNVVEFFDEL